MNFAVDKDPVLFVAFALLNLAGYNSENGWHFSDVRKDVRVQLAAQALHWRNALDRAGLLEPLLRGGGAMLMDVVPHLSLTQHSSEGAEKYSTGWQRNSWSALEGVSELLKNFASSAALESLWNKHGGSYEKAEDPLQRAIQRLQSVVSRCQEDNSDVSVKLKPNLLDAHGRGYSNSTLSKTNLFFGPVRDPVEAEKLAVHELLHRWVDVEAEQIILNNELGDPMPRARAQFRVVAEGYPESSIWLGETVARAATAWLVPSERKEVANLWESVGFVGYSDAYGYFSSEPEGSLEQVLKQAVRLVYERIKEGSW